MRQNKVICLAAYLASRQQQIDSEEPKEAARRVILTAVINMGVECARARLFGEFYFRPQEHRVIEAALSPLFSIGTLQPEHDHYRRVLRYIRYSALTDTTSILLPHGRSECLLNWIDSRLSLMLAHFRVNTTSRIYWALSDTILRISMLILAPSDVDKLSRLEEDSHDERIIQDSIGRLLLDCTRMDSKTDPAQ